MSWKTLLKRKTGTTKPKKSKLREWADAVVFAVVAASVIRGLLFSAYAIPSGSMEGTQLVGDYLFVSKFSYGPRMPFTPLSIPFTEPSIAGVKTYLSFWQLPYWRLPATSEVKKYDIIVFNKPADADQGIPVDERTALIKRCQATPGDELTIVNSQVYINGKPSFNAPKAQISYNVVTNGQDMNPEVFTALNITVIQQKSANEYEMIIPADALTTFKGYSNVKSVTPAVLPASQYDAEVFPHNEHFKWNMDNFGPLVLPKRGYAIALNDSTLTLYRRAIEVYEHNKVAVKGKDVFINNKIADTYTFKMNYYWMMGDNRHNSLDSRFWGYVPEDHIVGKALFTFMSIDSTKDIFHKIRWDRICKPIN
jgi:signal peptidase I